VEEITIQYTPNAEQFLNNLVDILFQEEYFGFKESSILYVQKIVDAAENKIISLRHKPTPEALTGYGEFYVYCKTTKHTVWYIFFSRKGNRILVKHITNNHVADAGFLQHF